MIDFNKNKLINSVLQEYYTTFSLTLDTCDFVPEKYNKKIHKFIFQNMKKKFREVNVEDRKYRRFIKKQSADIKKEKKAMDKKNKDNDCNSKKQSAKAVKQ